MIHQLHDGTNPVLSIGVLLWFRNNEPYIKKYLRPFLDRVEKMYEDVEFTYYIMENDSTDGTKEELRQLMSTRKGVLLMDDLDLNTDFGSITSSRINRMVEVRNHLLDKVRDQLVKHQWIWVMDSNIYADELNLKMMFDHLPRSKNVGLAGCNTIDVYYNNDNKDPISFCHYYDTFAFVNTARESFYPECVSSQCVSETCVKKVDPSKKIDFQGGGTCDVASAWGGFVLIDATVFENPNVRWNTLRVNHEDSFSLCEHIYLCDSITITSNKRIVIYGDVFAYHQKPRW